MTHTMRLVIFGPLLAGWISLEQTWCSQVIPMHENFACSNAKHYCTCVCMYALPAGSHLQR